MVDDLWYATLGYDLLLLGFLSGFGLLGTHGESTGEA